MKRWRTALWPLGCLLWLGVTTGCVFVPDVGYGVRSARVLGATETIRVAEADLDFLARIDTGARTTSLHALDIEIADPAPEMRANIGKRIRFRSVNEQGRSRHVESVIADVTTIRTAAGVEARFVVPLRLVWQGIEQEIRVNLRDRTPMNYKLLVGRDWIRGRFLVDVERNDRDDDVAGGP